ncbi:MAG: MBL fold metallo-hydrolase [Planctomycetes bacterium]|nr:MBL fold metallo-hydrolase [Planctomycetota bacterium]
MITIVYDNHPFDARLRTAWGFACVVEGLADTILFDTGGDGELLLENMAKAGFDVRRIDTVVLSHVHDDHTGGLQAFLRANGHARVFLPEAFPWDFKEGVRRAGARVFETREPCDVCDGGCTTGVLNRGIPEEGLCVETPEGPIVITGCAHPGVARMVEAAKEHIGSPVRAVLGGFHMDGVSARKAKAVIRSLGEAGIRQVAPCHCSGERTRDLMERAFGRGYLPSGVGARFPFGNQEREGRP